MKKNRWIILASGMLIQLCAGIIYMWSIFRTPVANHLSWETSGATLTSSIMLAAFVFGILLGGRAQDKLGPRKVCIAGSVMISLGMILTAFVPSSAPWLVYLSYGILGGLGVGTVYTTTVSAIQKWFPDKRGLATGLTVCAFGFSLVLFSPLANAMLAGLGVPATFMIFGGAFLLLFVLASTQIVNPEEGYLPAGYTPSASVSTRKQFTTSEMLKTGQFYFIALSMFFTLPAYFILNPLLKTLGAERGLSEGLSVLSVMITGIASASGRLILSWLSDKIGRKPALFTIALITLVSTLVLIMAKGALFLVCIAAIAFAFGGSASVYAATTADSFGTKYMGANYGCVMMAFGSSALIFPAISNSIAAGGDYSLSFIIAAATCALSMALVLFIKKPAGK